MITTLAIPTDDGHETELFADGDQLRITLRSPGGMQVRVFHDEHQARTIGNFIQYLEAQALRRAVVQGEDDDSEAES